MNYRGRIILITSLAALSMGAWAQDASKSGVTGGPIAATPSGAALTHTPGTPGASDTPGALQSEHAPSSTASSSPEEIRRLKEQARKEALSSAPSSAPHK